MFSCIYENNRLIFNVDYHNRERAKSFGAFWDIENKRWYKDLDKILLDYDNVFEIERALNSAGFDLSEDAKKSLSESIELKISYIQELENSKKDFLAPQPDGMAVELFPFQKAGVRFLEGLDKAILSDDMGLGKTCQSIGWARKKLPCLIICPASLKENWKREIFRFIPHASVALIKGQNIWYHKKDYNPLLLDTNAVCNAEWIVINYDIVGDWLSWLCEQNLNAIIADEGHFLKNPKAQRTNNCLLLSGLVQNRLCVTGTPILNRPTEFFTLLQFIGKVQKKDFWWWRKRYCELEEKTVPVYELDDSGERELKRDENGNVKIRKIQKVLGPKNYKELRETIRPYYLRRLKEEVLKELPSKLYQNHFIEITNRDEYDKAETDIVNWIAEHQGFEKASIAAKAVFLSKLNTLRQLSVAGKFKSILEIISDLEEQGKKSVIFSNFKEVLKNLKSKLGKSAVLYTGDDADQSSIDKFQKQSDVKWFLTTIKKGGVGLTLTESDTVIFIDLPWTPGEKSQAEDRCHRIGQKNNVTIIHVIGENTIDDMMLDTLEHKQNIISKIVDGIDDEQIIEQNVIANVEKMIIKKHIKKVN